MLLDNRTLSPNSERQVIPSSQRPLLIRRNDNEQQNRIFMHHSGLGMSLASRNWERSPQSYLSKQNLCNYSFETWARAPFKQKSSNWPVISKQIWIFL